MKISSMRWVMGMAVLAAGLTAGRAADTWVKYTTFPVGTLVSVDGTSTIHDWRVESKILAATFEAGPGFPTEAASAKPGKVQAKAEVRIPVRSLKSTKDGKPYSTSMDDIMYEKLLETTHKQITFSLKEMTLKEAPDAAGKPFLFDTKGDLTVAGETKEVTIPIQMLADGKQLTFKGEVALKMTDFKVDPPAPTIALGAIKTGDDIKIGINWITRTR
jgi:polyisoprenoid-binding protein YceI